MPLNTTYRLAYMPYLIIRGPMETIGREVIATEVPILEAMYGDGSVRRGAATPLSSGAHVEVTPAEEWDRLERQYGRARESDLTWAAQVYGSARGGVLESIMREADTEAATIVREIKAVAAAQSVHARQVPQTLDPGDDGTQGEIEASMPTVKDELVAELESRQLKVRVRDTVQHLQAMLTTARAIESMGATPVPGAGLEALEEQLDGVMAAANAGDDDGAQSEIENEATA